MDQIESHISAAAIPHLHLCIRKKYDRILKIVLLEIERTNAQWYQEAVNGETIAHAVAHSGSMKMLELIRELAENADENYRMNRDLLHQVRAPFSRILWTQPSEQTHETPLHQAVRYSFEGMVQWLLSQRSELALDVNARSMPLHWTALHYAVEANNLTIARMIIESGCDLDAKSVEHQTSLHFCAGSEHENVELLRLFVERGAKVDIPDLFGRLPIHVACRQGSLKMVKLLLVIAPHTINTPDEDGMTPLHHCAICGQSSILRLLLEYGADSQLKTNSGDLALHIACFQGKEDCVTFLLEGTSSKIFSRTNNGRTPLHQAALGGNPSTVLLLLRKYNADLMLKDHDGKTAQDLAHDDRTQEALKMYTEQCLPLGCKHLEKKEIESILNTIYSMSTSQISASGMERSLDRVFEKVETENRRRASILTPKSPLLDNQEIFHWDTCRSSFHLRFENHCSTLTHCGDNDKEFLHAQGSQTWCAGKHMWRVTVEQNHRDHLFIGVVECSGVKDSTIRSTIASTQKRNFLGKDQYSWSVDTHTGRKWHNNVDHPLMQSSQGLKLRATTTDQSGTTAFWMGLDMDTKSLHIQRNSEAPVVAFENMTNLKSASAALSLYCGQQRIHLHCSEYSDKLWDDHFILKTEPSPEEHAASPLRPKKSPRSKKILKKRPNTRMLSPKKKTHEPMHVQKRIVNKKLRADHQIYKI